MTVLHEFADDANGAFPWAPPIQAPDGNIYGVTNNGTNQGRVYRITSSGTFSVIAIAPSETTAPLILGADGNMYGTTPYGGTFNQGTVYQLTTKGKLKIIHSFGADGLHPSGPVLQGADGKLYGTTPWGGTNRLWNRVRDDDQRRWLQSSAQLSDSRWRQSRSRDGAGKR